MKVLVFGFVFFIGVIFGGISEWFNAAKNYRSNIEQTCQGKPLVIQESLITKTLTCEVKLKEKK